MSAADELSFLSAQQLCARRRRGELSSRDILDASLQRIEALNPALNAIVTLDAETAMALADKQDQQAQIPDDQPLFGLPVAIKDLAQTRGLRTTMGSPIYAGFVPDVDELFVSRLRNAGAIIIGKTNTPEFGAGSQTFNSLFGATRNPYDLNRTCGGSSGGAAVALASGMLAIADGSDLGGSLRNPASFCNVVGLRPSPGRVPSWPKQFSSEPLAVHGPMAREVSDVALLLSAMAGPDARVPISLPQAGDFFQTPLERNLRGLKIAYSPGLERYPIDHAVTAVLAQTPAVFESLGCVVENAAPDLSDVDEIFYTLRAFMFAARGEQDYRNHYDQIKDTVRWNIEQGLKLSAADIALAETRRSALNDRVAAFFEHYDFLVCAAAQVPPFDVNEPWVKAINGEPLSDYLQWMGVCYAITVTGLPAISVPAGFTADGLPVGVQIVARRWADLALLQLAYGFEQATRFAHQHPPLSQL